MTALTLIVPSVAETQLTGFIGAHEKLIRGHLWRVEWWSGQSAKFFRDGKPIAVDIHANRSVGNLMMTSFNFFKSANS